ncbi:MAG: type 4a pilus biogenesis protein PilO, partial [Actinomycetota bacterium]|nr:type 4a pilus biogenesis protein PilO [Actinomycetota bacterium]
IRDELSQADVQLGRLRSIEADLPRMQSGIETLRAAVPDDVGLADFILSVNEAAVEAGLEVQSIVPDQPRAGMNSGLTEINIGLNTEGGYYKILDFLNRMSAMHRVITIENLGLSAFRGDNPAQEPSLQVTMRARIYVNPAAAAAAAAPAGTGSADAGAGDTGQSPSEQ